jgi:uncharacterized protein YcbK (DUF882 family)
MIKQGQTLSRRRIILGAAAALAAAALPGSATAEMVPPATPSRLAAARRALRAAAVSRGPVRLGPPRADEAAAAMPPPAPASEAVAAADAPIPSPPRVARLPAPAPELEPEAMVVADVIPCPPARPSTGRLRLALHNIHTAENIDLVFGNASGHIPGALSQLDHFFRDFRADAQIGINPALYDLLSRMQGELGNQTLHLVSGYRTRATNAMLQGLSANSGVATNSYHIQGMAADITVPDIQLSHVRDLALNMQAGGVGYYPSSGFVHMDVGPVRRW